ncbi:MAG: ribonuclease III domain-containing protein [Lachnospiraceae bacterium]|nr:ribonuclease III domain-containing protein [Lachnospiraceae bacterium]
MEESLSLLDKIKKTFDCDNVDVRTYSPLTLAFMGDCVFEIVIRSIVVERGNRQAGSLHKAKTAVVNAKVQARMIEALMEELTEEERAVYKRGRNAKPHTVAKNASVNDYRKATGLEALFGYLYLNGQEDRILELTKRGLKLVNITI